MIRRSVRLISLFILISVLASAQDLLSNCGRPTLEEGSRTATYPLQLDQAVSEAPLHFEPNRGQVNADAQFISRGLGYVITLRPNEVNFTLGQEVRANPKSSTVSIRLLGANSSAPVTQEAKLRATSNYFFGNIPSKWLTNIPTYDGVRYHGVYPGVDLRYYGKQRQLEHDFIVAPGANADSIAFALHGNKGLHVDRNGDLVIRTVGGELRLLKPKVYQVVSGLRKEVDGRYLLTGDHVVRFRIAPYDHQSELVIDPVLSYSTYMGGTATDQAQGVALDSAGNTYVIGQTTSTNYPTKSPYQSTNRGSTDVFISKFASDGTLVFSTYLGGTGSDIGWGVAADSTGAYVVGQTTSTNFPVKNAFQSIFGGSTDAFVTKIAPDGASLVFSTYLGGNGVDYGFSIASDTSGNVYVTGQTSSTNFPSKSPIYSGKSGTYDAFVTKLASTGSSLVYSTYLGGTGDDFGKGIAVDTSGNAFVTGYTTSSNFPTVSAVQGAYGGGTWDAFVAKVKADGSALLFSTFLGGSGNEQGAAITVDASGAPFITGYTASTNFPTRNPIQGTAKGSNDAFVTKLAADGSALLFSTYLGGTGLDQGTGIAVDASGNAYISGYTASPATSFPLVNALQSTFGGGTYDAFVTKIASDGSSLLFSSYLGGSGTDQGTAIAVNSFGNAFTVGYTASANFPTANPYQATNRGGVYDAFLAKITGIVATSTAISADVNPQKSGSSVTFTAYVTPSGGNPTPSGTVTFSDGATQLAQVSVDGTGHASYATNALSAGPHTIKAAYSGDAVFSSSNSTTTETIVGPPATISVASGTGQTTSYGTSFPNPLVVLVTDQNSYPVPAAMVTFTGSGLSFSNGGLALTDTNGHASVTVTGQVIGSLTANASVAGVSNPATFSLTVTKTVPVVTWNTPAPILYGTPLSGTQLNASSSVPGIFSYSPAVGTVLAAGTQTLSTTFTPTDTTNYTTATASVLLVVDKAPLTVRASSTSRTYGTSNPIFTATYVGFVNGDTSSVLLGTPSLTTSATTSSPAGSYAIVATQGSLSAANYSFVLVNGTLTVNPATLTVKANDFARTYGAANPAFTYTISGFVNGDTQSVVSGSPVLTTAAIPTSTVGSYPIVPALGSLSAVNYVFAFANGTLAINPAVLTVTADNVSRAYGSANPELTYSFSGFVNGESASVLTGTPSMFTPATFTSPVGSYSVIPSQGSLNAQNYTFTYAAGTLAIYPATPTILWPSPVPILYGTPLSVAQLNATSSAPGTLAYAPGLGAVLGVGNQTLSVTFTPTDSLNYTSVSASVVLTVNKATPVITWANPKNIPFRTPLSSTQLNASANVPGVFVYDPPEGAVLGVGAHTLAVTFTPSDPVDYGTASASVVLVVTPASPVLFYSDLESGPATGGEGGVDGAFVCVYGENFGVMRGSSTVTIGGVEAAQYKLWTDPGSPYQPGTNVAKACVQISHLTAPGLQDVQLITSDGSSNPLPFTVRPGSIWWVGTSGDDVAGDGSQGNPWNTIIRCKNQMAPGDICVVQDGVTVNSMEDWEASLWLNSSGTPGNPKAIVAYPGAKIAITTTVASGAWAASGQLQGINNYPGGTASCGAGGCSYWTIAGFSQINGSNGGVSLLGGSNIRLIDNDIVCQGAYCDGGSGGLATSTSQLAIYGNRFHDIGCHDDVDYQHSAHPCAWQSTGMTLSTSGVTFTFAGLASGLTEGDVVRVNGEVRRMISCNTSCLNGSGSGILDSPLTADVPFGTPFQFRHFVPSKLWQNIYFGNHSNSVQFGWNNVDGSVGKACRGVQFHATPVDSTTGFSMYDLHVHDNFIHDTVCDGINFATVDPSQGTVEAYNNLIYNTGEGNGGIFNGGDPVGGISHYACIYSPGYRYVGTPGSGSILVYNNTMYNCGGRVTQHFAGTQVGGIAAVTGSTPNLYVVASNNVFYSADPGEPYLQNFTNRFCTGATTYCSGPSVNNVFYGSTTAPPAAFSGNVSKNPQFASAPTDFHLYVSNPAANAATPGLAATRDFDGSLRSTTNPTPGAYEYLSTAPSNGRAPLASVTNLTTDANPQEFGLRLVFTVHVTPLISGLQTPSGPVVIYDGSTKFTELSLDAAGYASFAIWSLIPGNHTFGAVYRGDENFGPSSGSASQFINGPVPDVSPSSLTFSSPLNGATMQTVTVRNTGDEPMTVNSVSLAGSTDFSVTGNTCLASGFPASVPVGQSCTIQIDFKPVVASTSPRKAQLMISTALPAPSQTIPITGTIIIPTYTLQPALSFDPQMVNTTSDTKAVTLTNTSSLASLTLTGVVAPAGWIVVKGAGSCQQPVTLAAGNSCVINLAYRPTAPGLVSTQLKVLVAAPAKPASVGVTGTAVARITFTPTALNFGTVPRGAATIISLQVTNPSKNPPVTGLAFNLSGSGSFSRSATNPGTCGTAMTGGSIAYSCTVNLVYSPTTSEKSGTTDLGTLTVTGSSDGVAQNQTVSLRGIAN